MNQPIIAPPATFSPDYKSAPTAPLVPSASAPSKVASPSGAFSVAGGSIPVASAEAFADHCDTEATISEKFAGRPNQSDYDRGWNEGMARGLRQVAKDIRRLVGLATVRQPESNGRSEPTQHPISK